MESGVWEIAASPDGVTMAFLTMSMAEIFHSFNMRSQRGSVFTPVSYTHLDVYKRQASYCSSSVGKDVRPINRNSVRSSPTPSAPASSAAAVCPTPPILAYSAYLWPRALTACLLYTSPAFRFGRPV